MQYIVKLEGYCKEIPTKKEEKRQLAIVTEYCSRGTYHTITLSYHTITLLHINAHAAIHTALFQRAQPLQTCVRTHVRMHVCVCVCVCSCSHGVVLLMLHVCFQSDLFVGTLIYRFPV